MDLQLEAKFSQYLAQFRLLKARKGEILSRPGDPFHQLIFLKKGTLRQYTISKLGQELSINTISPQFPFAFVHLLTGSKNKYFLEAFTAVEFVKITKKDFSEYLQANPDMYAYLTTQMAKKLEEIMVNIEYYITGDAYMKVASIYFLLAKRFGKESENQTEIEMIPTHKDISGLLGLTRETVSLQILKLEKDKVITRKGRKVFIPNMKKLEEASAYVGE